MKLKIKKIKCIGHHCQTLVDPCETKCSKCKRKDLADRFAFKKFAEVIKDKETQRLSRRFNINVFRSACYIVFEESGFQARVIDEHGWTGKVGFNYWGTGSKTIGPCAKAAVQALRAYVDEIAELGTT